MLGTERYLDELVLHTTAFADALHHGDLGSTVPACPEWTLAGLVEHLGRVHRRVAGLLERPDEPAPRRSEVPDGTPPATVDEISTWLLAGAARAAAAMRAVGDDTVVPGFTEPVPARFWARRMACETLVHRFDAEATAGVDPWLGVAPEIAADAVSEWLGMLAVFGTAHRPGIAGDGETLHLHATDGGLGEAGEWVVTRLPDGITVEQAHRKSDVAVRGPATGLLAVLLGRRDADDPAAGVEVLGDAELFAHWRSVATM